MPDVAEIAGRLSEAQRRALRKGGLDGLWSTTVALQRRGLVQLRACFPDGKGVSLTHLGLAVRAYLENSRVTD